MEEINITNELEKVFDSEADVLEKISASFKLITDTILMHSELEIELRRAMNDRETIVKEQIKRSTIQHIRSIYGFCHLRATGQKPWQEEDAR
jgi:hypothetical protein